MFHSNTLRMMDGWRELREGDLAPRREDFDPTAFANLLPQTFMLARTAGLPFRLAGGLVEDLHGRSLRRESFLGLWAPHSRAAVRDAAACSLAGAEPAILYAEAHTAADDRAGLELMLAPLIGPDGEIDRLLGFYQPLSTLVRLHGQPLIELDHKLTVFAGAEHASAQRGSHLRLAAVDGRRIA